MSVLQVHVTHLDTTWSSKENKLNLNFVSYALGHLASHNLMSSQETKQVYSQNLITTHFVLSTLRHMHKFDDRPPNILQSIPWNVNVDFTWIMVSCGHHLLTFPKKCNQKTV